MKSAYLFLYEFLRRPLEVASLVPSSPFLKARLMQTASIATASTIIELGPGTGGTTRALLAAMPPHARLLSIEVNARFHEMLRGIDDPRLMAHLGSAVDLERIAAEYGMAAPDTVISGIPFSQMSERDGKRVVEAVARVLAPGGQFVAYQVSDRVAALTRPYLGAEQVIREPRNVPPMRLYRWRKPAG